MFIEQAQEAQLPKHGGGHGRVHVTRPGIPPRPTAVEGGCAGARLVEATPTKFAEPGPWPLPLAPQRCSAVYGEATCPNPRSSPSTSANRKYDDPASRREVELLHDVGEASASPTSQHAAEFRLQPLHGCRRDPQARGRSHVTL